MDGPEKGISNMNAYANNAHQHYQKAQVEGASPAKLVLMLYDGAAKKLNQAQTEFAAGNVEAGGEHVVRVQKIITELAGALDFEAGGEVSVNLGRLYEYMISRLGLALIKRDRAILEEIRSLVEELRSGWQEAIDQLSEAEEPATQTETAPKTKATPVRPIENNRTRQLGLLNQQRAVPSLNIAG